MLASSELLRSEQPVASSSSSSLAQTHTPAHTHTHTSCKERAASGSSSVSSSEHAGGGGGGGGGRGGEGEGGGAVSSDTVSTSWSAYFKDKITNMCQVHFTLDVKPSKEVILLYMCPHTIYYYVCVLILTCVKYT